LRKLKVNKNKLDEYPKWPVGYGTIRVMVPYPANPREGKCDACARTVKSGQIKTTQLHHWIYKYKHNTIKKNPLLALENLSELCYSCHQIADALRQLMDIRDERLKQIVLVALLMPNKRDKKRKSMKDRLDWFARAWQSARKKDKKTRIDQYK
jgi:hypothetical protein